VLPVQDGCHELQVHCAMVVVVVVVVDDDVDDTMQLNGVLEV
jgi:hypothetical protein